MKDKSVVDEHVVKALNTAGIVSKEALRIKAEMDKFYEENREWLQEEDKQIIARDETVSKQDEKVLAQIAAARKRFDDYKGQLKAEIARLIRRKSLEVRQKESGWMVFGK